MIYTLTRSLQVLVTSHYFCLLILLGFKISTHLVGLKWYISLYPLPTFLLACLPYSYWCIKTLLCILHICVNKFLLVGGLYIFFYYILPNVNSSF